MALALNSSQVDVLLGRYLPRLAAVLLVLLLAFTLAELSWQWLAPSAGGKINPVTPATANVAPTGPARQDYGTEIANLHLFGQANRVSQPVAQAAPETRLDLKLRGVFATQGADALAILGQGNSSERFYHVGDAIANGVVLKAVYHDHVLIERNQQLEKVRLPKAEQTGGGGAAALAPSLPEPYIPAPDETFTEAEPEVGDSEIFSAHDMPVDADEFTEEEAFEEAPEDMQEATDPDVVSDEPQAPPNPDEATEGDLNSLRQKILEDPTQLSSILQAIPVTENGQFSGFRLLPADNAETFAQLGLQSGDLVTAVNGIPLDRPEQGLQALQSLMQTSQVDLTLRRDGTEIHVQHDFQ